ncbi:hypothetical protein [Legionella sp. CNM-4043-24]|uniref:hypothetical protein n=1 Tax=Legionella sp. CNM-4043-24 TaxID=3421646 RepID=UPI00403AA5A1
MTYRVSNIAQVGLDIAAEFVAAAPLDDVGLDLSRNFLGHLRNQQLIFLVSAISQHTQTLDLSCNSLYLLNQFRLSNLCINIPSCVKTLSLAGNGLGSLKNNALGMAIMNLDKLERLDLARNRFGLYDTFDLSQLMVSISENITELNLAGNFLHRIPPFRLFHAMTSISPNIQSLNLADNGLGSISNIALEKFLSSIPQTVREINLKENQLTEEHCRTVLVDWLKESCVHTLFLDEENLSEGSKAAIQAALIENRDKIPETYSLSDSTDSMTWYCSFSSSGSFMA